MLTDLLVFGLCLMGSAFFSASETALTSLPITRLEALRFEGNRLSRAAFSRWANAPGEFLVTILIGNNLVNVVASALASRMALTLSDSGSLAAAVGVTTLAILIFGEISPKTLAQQYPEFVSRRTAPLLLILDFLLRPITPVFALISRLLRKGKKKSIPVTEKDLLYMLRLAHRHAQLPRESTKMIESVLRFQQALAREVMLPRPRIINLDRGWDFERVLATIREAGHSRFPLIDGSPDHILGIVHVKKLLGIEAPENWTSVAQDALFIPESKAVPELLQEFRTSGVHMAIVLDEFGGCAGMVTLEDVMELLVGEIRDEFEEIRDADLLPTEKGFSLAAHISLRRLERLFERNLDQAGEVDSIGGLLLRELGGKVSDGDEIRWSGLKLRVLSSLDGRPQRVEAIDLED